MTASFWFVSAQPNAEKSAIAAGQYKFLTQPKVCFREIQPTYQTLPEVGSPDTPDRMATFRPGTVARGVHYWREKLAH